MSARGLFVVFVLFVFVISSYGADGGKLWDSTGELITLNGTTQYNFDMATDQNGGFFFAWEAGTGYEIVLQKIDNTGQRWASEVVLADNFLSGNQNPDVISDNAGGVIVAWVEKIVDDVVDTWVYKAQRVNASGTELWASAVSLTSSYIDAYTSQPKPRLVSDGGSGAFVAMQSDGSCHVVHINGTGVLSGGVDGVDLGFDLGDAVSDGAGGVIVAGQDSLNLLVLAGRVVLDGGAVTSVWTAGGATVGDTTSSTLTQVHAIPDGYTGAIICWNTGTDVRVQRLDSSGNQLWAAGGLELVSSADVGGVWTYGITSDLCTNGAEGAYVVWTDWRNEPSSGGNCDIYAQHVNSAGEIVWAEYGVRLNSSTLAGSQRYPTICVDRVGGALCTWQDYYGLSYNIRACRVNAADGSRDWSTWVIDDDVYPSSPGEDQLYPKILFTNDGPATRGAIVAWNDERAAMANYCQKLEVGTAEVPLAPSDLTAAIISPQINLTWKDNSANESGFRIEYKKWYRYSIEPTSWTVLDTTGPDVMSYQWDEGTYNYYYKFRVCAFNSYGDSAYSNEVSVLVLFVLYTIDITSPNGGEIFAAGASRDITWTASSGIVTVTIDYSIDGGSHWIEPPIATGTWNDGLFTWTVPDTLSDNCILRIRDAIDGSPYDLSDEPFSIVTAGPDLIVESLTCDQQDTAVQDTTLNYHCTVRNVGSQNTGTFLISFYSNWPAAPIPGQLGSQYTVVTGGLAAGASYNWDFDYEYATPGQMQEYVKVDSGHYISEVDENNNILGPQELNIHEFEYIEEANDGTMWWFGGDDRDGWTRNKAIGQSFTLPRSAHVDYAGFNFWTGFDYYENPEGLGHAVTLVLNIRAEDGTIVKTVSEDLPASFVGGWVLFDMDADLWGRDTYIFTCYLQDAQTNNLTSYVRVRADDPWPDSQGYGLDNRTSPYDMETWGSWITHSYDFNFRIAGNFTDLSKADFTQDYQVDLEDTARLAVKWLRSDCVLPGWCDRTDMDYSSSVDLSDLVSWASWWLWEGYGWLDRAKIAAMDAQLSTSNIDGSDGAEFWPGTYFIYKTNSGRYGKFIVEKWQRDVNNQLTIGWITYNADGTIYTTGSGLVIGGTYSCDLDIGAETSTDSDWAWVQSTSEVRYLNPRNGAVFKLMYLAPEP